MGDVIPLRKKKLEGEIIEQFMPTVRIIASAIKKRLPASVDIDDLIAAGTIGLLDAIRRYDPTRPNRFKTYAEFRIRGEILDELRRLDFIPRSIRDHEKNLNPVISEFKLEHGREPTDLELADIMGEPLEKIFKLKELVEKRTFLPVEDPTVFTRADKRKLFQMAHRPFVELEAREETQAKIDHLFNLIQTFKSKRMARVMFLYYQEGMALKEIARQESITESRASQLIIGGRERLKSLLTRSEMDVASGVLQGKSNKEIAGDLFVAEKTVKFHLTNIYKKTECKNRSQLIIQFQTPNHDFIETKPEEPPHDLPVGEANQPIPQAPSEPPEPPASNIITKQERMRMELQQVVQILNRWVQEI